MVTTVDTTTLTLYAMQAADRAARKRQETSWRDWLARHFASYTRAPFADRHIRFWEWVTALHPNIKPRPRVEVWGRGGAKSTTIELGCAYLGSIPAPVRKFVLYVSETQVQANAHVQAVASMLERVGMGRAVNQYGASKGWRQTQVRARNGFNVMAFGLDAGMRGIKLDEFRPDLIVFDDIDGRHDTPTTTQKKIEVITESVLPAGSADCAVIVIQNKIHQDSIVSQLCDGRADFLHDRLPATVEPAVRGLKYERVVEPDGSIRFHITEGTATWPGQDIATCERQMAEWGERAFLREAQHQVENTGEGIFKPWWWGYWQPRGANLPPVTVKLPDGTVHLVQPMELPAWWEQAITSWDMTFKKTEAGSFVAGLAVARHGTTGYVLDCFHERVDFVGSKAALRAMASRHTYATGHLVEDKANGPAIVSELRGEVAGLVEWPVAGSKGARAHAAQPHVLAGNWLLPHPHLSGAGWVPGFIKELGDFTGEKLGEVSDQVDAFSQADHFLFGQQAYGWDSVVHAAREW